MSELEKTEYSARLHIIDRHVRSIYVMLMSGGPESEIMRQIHAISRALVALRQTMLGRVTERMLDLAATISDDERLACLSTLLALWRRYED
jgi:DNA-binding FrmR family transcriptional regulator